MAGSSQSDSSEQVVRRPQPADVAGAAESAPAASDAELIRRHVAGEQDAFGELVRRHRDRLWAVALRTLGDREEAADALQDAMISAFRSAHTFQGRSAVTTWLHRIVVNACLDRARRAASRPTRPLDEESRSDDLLGHDEGADISAERGELRRELAAALATLPTDQRAALVLVDMQGYPVAEAAAILGVPTGTVKSRCARGRARLLPQIAHLRASVADPPGPEPAGAHVSRETPDRPHRTVSRETTRAPGASAPPHAPGPAPDHAGQGDTPVAAGGRNPKTRPDVPPPSTPHSAPDSGPVPQTGGEQPA